MLATMSETAAKKQGCLPGIVVLLFVGGFGVGLPAILISSCNEGRRVIEPYIASVRAGQSAQPLAPDDDTAEAHRVLLRSHDVSFGNYGVNRGTGCWSATVNAPEGKVSVRFLMQQVSGEWRVAKVSTRRECQCPRRGACSLQ